MSDSEEVFQAMDELARANPTTFKTLSEEERARPVPDGMVRVGFTDGDGKTGEFEVSQETADRLFGGGPGLFSIDSWQEAEMPFRPMVPPLMPKLAMPEVRLKPVPARPGDLSPDPDVETEEIWKALTDQSERLDEVAARLAELDSLALPMPDQAFHRRNSALHAALDFTKARLAAGQSPDAGEVVRDAAVFAEYLADGV